MCNIRKNIKAVQKLRGADIYCDNKLLHEKLCFRVKKIIKYKKGITRWNVENLYVLLQKAEYFVEGKLLGRDLKLGMRKCSGQYQ
jgi:hypothetical protein